MIQIKDYSAGKEKTFGIYSEVRFLCINQSFPAAKEPKVTYVVTTPDGETDTITVSLIHTIESATK